MFGQTKANVFAQMHAVHSPQLCVHSHRRSQVTKQTASGVVHCRFAQDLTCGDNFSQQILPKICPNFHKLN